MLAFLEDAHRSRKTGDIRDKKVKRIVETVKEKINDQLTQGGSTETNNLTQADINHLVLQVKLVFFFFFAIFCAFLIYFSFYRKSLSLRVTVLGLEHCRTRDKYLQRLSCLIWTKKNDYGLQTRRLLWQQRR